MNKNKRFTDYQWEGFNSRGEKVKGTLKAPSVLLAKAELYKKEIVLKKIHKQRYLWRNPSKQITQMDIAIFSRQMATMLAAGISLIQAFDVVQKGQTNQRMRSLLENIKKDIETGLTFTESLYKYPIFNKLYCSLIDIGEKSGSLELMLNRIANYKEKFEVIKRKIKKALIYPVAVLIIALIVTMLLLIFVIPQFAALFKAFGAELPLLTRKVISLSQFFQNYGHLFLSIFISAICSVIYARKHSRPFMQWIDKTMLKLPILGSILIKTIIARFSRSLAIAFSAGLPLIEALKSVAETMGNSVYNTAIHQMREEISTGQSMLFAMENTGLFPKMVVQMIAIGEESGTFEHMLNKIADYYEEEIDTRIDTLNTLLEPFIMSILGILVGSLIIAMYVPIFKLGSVM